MGLLTSDYYTNLMKTSAPAPAPVPAPVPVVAPAPAPAPVQAAVTEPSPVSVPVPAGQNPPVDVKNTVLPTDKKGYLFNGPFATEARDFVYTAANKILSMGGASLPEEDTFNKMGPGQQAANVFGQGAGATVGMIAGLPKAIATAPFKIATSVLAPIDSMTHGEKGSYEDVVNAPKLQLPWIGTVSNYFQDYDAARKSGMGPIAAAIQTGSGALMDSTISASMGEALNGAFRPSKALRPGEVLENTKPIQTAIDNETGVFKKKAPSSSEYYSMPKSVASKYGGNSSNTYLKMTPGADGTAEVSVVQLRGGKIPEAIDYVKGKTGVQKVYQGDFGPEIKLDSSTVPLTKSVVPKPEAAAPAGVTEAPKTFSEFNPDDQKFLSNISDRFKPGPSKAPIPEADWKIAEDTWKKNGFTVPDTHTAFVKLIDNAQESAFNKGMDSKAIQPISRPLKGFEDAPITQLQMDNIGKIGEVNGIDPAIRDQVIKAVTGKDTLGELTQAEYAKAAETLGAFNNLSRYAPDAPVANLPARYLSPQRYWMRGIEEKTGVPIYSEGYTKMEDAIRLRNTFDNSYKAQFDEVYGKYAKPGFGEERRAIKYYMEGDKSAIMSNPTFDDATKADLVNISNKMRVLYDKMGTAGGIPTEVFLKDYQPHIQNIGGIYQLYKDGDTIPEASKKFFDFKRHGSLSVQVDDSLSLAHIYSRALANKLFVNPALDSVGQLVDSLPEGMKGKTNVEGGLTSYIQEKLGYAGPLERWVNTMGTNVGNFLGLNVPPDIARQLTGVMMDTTYSGAMGLNPGTVVRNGLQYDLMSYPRLGPQGYLKAMDYALNPKTAKLALQEVRDGGFLVDQGNPYGINLDESAGSGAIQTGINKYKAVTSSTLKPFSLLENLNRVRTYFHTKFQFEDALSKFNSGQITWPKFEQSEFFKGMSPVDKNIVRQKLISGDIKGAFEHTVRDILDETQFPYRKGSGARINYGLPGKLTTQFSQYTIEFGHTMKKWTQDAFRTGDFSNLIRFAGASSAIARTMRQSFGFDFSKSVGAGPLNPSFSPLVQTGIDFQQMIAAKYSGNDQEYTKNADAIVNEIKSLGIPAGVEGQKVSDFMTSYKKGPDAQGQYGVYDQRGRLKYRTTFKDLFWTMMGFPSAKNSDVNKVNSDMQNATFNRGLQKQQILQLMQQGKMKEAGDLMGSTGIVPTADDMKQYYIPLDERTYQSLPPILKAKFANQVYQNNQITQ